MAFSTQKGFQHVPFLNEYPQPICPPMEGIKLKTYAGTHDQRAWSMSDKKKAQYLIDLVSCRMYDDDNAGDGLQENSTNRSQPCEKQSIGQIFPKNNNQEELIDSLNAEKDALRFRLNESQENLRILKDENAALTEVISEDHQPVLFDQIKRKISQLRKASKIDKNDENELLKMLDTLSKANKAFSIKNRYLSKSVEKQSQRSDLPNIPIEPETNTDVNYLQNEVNSLRSEVAQLRDFKNKTLRKETVSRENQSPEQQVDKNSENFDNIKAERNALREKCESFASIEGKIIEWKNDAEHFKTFRKKACLALRQKDEQINDCRERIEEVEYEFKEMVKCFKVKEKERVAICSAYDCLKEENQLLKEEICRCNCDLKVITSLRNQNQLLSKELCEKNCAIEQYDLQFQQLLGVIEGLPTKTNVDIRSLEDVNSQTYSENIEELAISTRATLDQISKELEQRQELEADLAQSMADLETIRRESEEKEKATLANLNEIKIENQKLTESLHKTSITVKESLEQFKLKVNPDEDCSIEVARLNEFITKLKSEHENEIELLINKSTDILRDLENEKKTKGSDAERLNLENEKKTKGSDAERLSDEANNLKIELASAQDENRQLKIQQQDLNKALEECQNKVKDQKEEIKKLDQRTTELLCSSEASLKEVGKLVNDINNVQDRNENLKSVLGAVDYSEKSKQEIEDLKKLLDDEIKKSKNLAEQNKVLQKDLDQAKEMLNSLKSNSDGNGNKEVLQGDVDQTKKTFYSQITVKLNNEPNKDLQKVLEQTKEITSSRKKEKTTNDQTFRAVVKTSDEQETDSKRKSVSKPSDALVLPGSSREKKGSTKLNQLQKLHEATRNAERNFYEKEIEGHRLSNELLKNSLTKLTSKVQNSSAAEFEKEMRSVLDNFALEICKWRCEKNFKKLTKLQEICKRILDYGINCLSYKDLVYLHQRMSEAALRLKPNCLSTSTTSSQKDLMCCKCSGKICEVAIIPKENRILLEKMLILEREIQSAREDLRMSKEEKEICNSDVDKSDPDTIRAIPNQTSSCLVARKIFSRPKSSRFSYKIKEEEFQIPTKDRCA